MLNQTFSKENYLKVINYENRKGSNFERYHFTDIYEKFIREHKELKSDYKAANECEREEIKLKLKDLREQKNTDILENITTIKLENIKIERKETDNK